MKREPESSNQRHLRIHAGRGLLPARASPLKVGPPGRDDNQERSAAVQEKTMPHIIVKLYPGRSDQQKTQLAEEIAKDVVAIAK
jgi:hypothetical protein